MTRSKLSTWGSVSPNLQADGHRADGRMSTPGKTPDGEGREERKHRTYRVLIILRKAAMEVMRVTMCARPVRISVMMTTGQEKARNCSNVSKN